MNKNKKIFFSFLAVIIILVAIFLLIKDDQKKSSNINKEEISVDDFMEKTTFIEREDIIQDLLAKKYQLNDGVEALIARESNNHINGVFFIENFNNEELFQGKFFATTDDYIDIIWAGQGEVDCSKIIYYNFPPEMASECF